MVDDRPKAALLMFSQATMNLEDGADSTSAAHYEGSLLSLAQACVHLDDRAKFNRLFLKNNAGPDELVEMVVGPALEIIAGRPTSRSSDSSDGPSAIESKPVSDSNVSDSPVTTSEPSPVEAKLAKQFDGRPDKLGVVLDLQQWLQTG